MSEAMDAICDKKISDLLEKNTIVQVAETKEGFFSNIFVIPKRGGGFRPIVNLKKLNLFVFFEQCKMEGMDTVRFMIPKYDWFTKQDVKDANLAVSI